MESYKFKATAKATDYVRICRENPEARLLVVKSEGLLPLTFVRAGSAEHFALRKRTSAFPRGRVLVTSSTTYLIFDGDLSEELEPKILTVVEAH